MDEQQLSGLMRCADHARRFAPITDKDEPRYFIPPEATLGSLVCVLELKKGHVKRAGLIVNQRSLDARFVCFRAHGAMELSDNAREQAQRIWPR